MNILNVSGGMLTVLIGPDDCLTLATACQFAADATAEDEAERCPLASRETSYLYATLGRLLEAYALVAATKTFMRPADDKRAQLPLVVEEWGVVRAWPPRSSVPRSPRISSATMIRLTRYGTCGRFTRRT